MNAADALRSSAALLACLGTVMLAVSEENAVLGLLAVVVSTAAYLLCDVTGRFQLGVRGANAAAGLALLVCAVRYRTSAAEDRILIMADLMAYLQFILQFRPKIGRLYWLIALVSFLQVAVASALYSGIGFALLLTAYLGVGTYFLGVFFLERERGRCLENMARDRRSLESQGYGFVAAVQLEDDPTRPRMEFRRRTLGMIVGTIGLSALFFVAVPRMGQTAWAGGDIGVGRTVGFSSEINLTRSGTLVEDPDVVLRVQFTDRETAAPIQVHGDLYLRGTSVAGYSEGRWQQGSFQSNSWGAGDPTVPLLYKVLADDRGVVRQQITLEPLSSTTVFSCYPPFTTEPTNDLAYNAIVGRLVRQDRLRSVRFSYELDVAALHADGRQADVVPLFRSVQRRSGRPPFEELGVPPDPARFAGLAARAAQVVADTPAEDVFRRCKALESHLRDSGQYAYSATAEERPPDVDPLEDFVVSRPRGHCEYFAGALAMMLRSVGIRARVVLGYRGGEWNAVGSFYQFQQLHAHSWVEAYLPAEAFQDEPNASSAALRRRLAAPSSVPFAQANGAWLQLDGTTSFTAQTAAAAYGTWHQVLQTVDYLRFLWNNYVVGMDAARQRDEVYTPVVGAAYALAERAADRATWIELLRDLPRRSNPLRLLPAGAGGGARAAVIGFALVIVVGAAYGAARMGRGWWTARRSTRRRIAPRAGPTIDFYVRLEGVLKVRRLTRTADQTQREFVQAACGELAELPETRGVAGLPRKIVEAYYGVRFGRRTLDAAERAEIDRALDELQARLRPPGAGAR